MDPGPFIGRESVDCFLDDFSKLVYHKEKVEIKNTLKPCFLLSSYMEMGCRKNNDIMEEETKRSQTH